jgi:hypothetical protein
MFNNQVAENGFFAYFTGAVMVCEIQGYLIFGKAIHNLLIL